MTSISNTAQAESNALFLDYQNGNTNALGELYQRWNAYIIKHITKSNAFAGHLDIEDVASEVWIRVQENALKWDIDRCSFFKFLNYQIKKSIAETCRKRETFKRRADHEGFRVHIEDDENRSTFIEQLASDEPSAMDLLIYKERVDVIKKAIAVCGFPRQTRQILNLRLQGLTDVEIQTKLELKSRSQVTAVLSKAVKQLRATINPKTLEIQAPPKPQRTQRDELAVLGIQLAELCRKQGYKPLKLAETLQLRTEYLMAFLKGERKPHAPVLQRLASVLGEPVYAIYAPPLTNYPYAEQGQHLWYARVRQGYTILKLARQIQLRSGSSIRTYEHGWTRPPEDRLTRMAETLTAPQLLELYA